MTQETVWRGPGSRTDQVVYSNESLSTVCCLQTNRADRRHSGGARLSGEPPVGGSLDSRKCRERIHPLSLPPALSETDFLKHHGKSLVIISSAVSPPTRALSHASSLPPLQKL